MGKRYTGKEWTQPILPWGGTFERKEGSKIYEPSQGIVTPHVEGVIEQMEFPGYRTEFGPGGKYTEKVGDRWVTRRGKELSSPVIASHLAGLRTIGAVSPWYPCYMILDIDNRTLAEVREIRSALGTTSENSLLEGGERKNHYHLVLRIAYRGRPLTIKLLQLVCQRFAIQHRIELYPQVKRTIRLPFGPYQPLLDAEYRELERWEEKFKRYRSLVPFDLTEVPRHQIPLQLAVEKKGVLELGDLETAEVLLLHGLQRRSSRNYSQYRLLDYFWRRNINQEEAVITVKHWIRTKHNGLSTEVNRGAWKTIDDEIERRASTIYSGRAFYSVYPDAVHLGHRGFITREDLVGILKLNHGSWPRSKFWFEVIKYANSRRHLAFINVHRDKLIEWASTEIYLRYLDEWEKRGLIERGQSYLVGQFSKAIRFTGWKLSDSEKAVCYGGRAVTSLSGAFRLALSPEEFTARMRAEGVDRVEVWRRRKEIYEEGRKKGLLDLPEEGIQVELVTGT
jgi:hypothetical protein